MKSVLEEISRLRKNQRATIDKSNDNRYRLLLSEADGSKTAYYFSSPIYHTESGKLVYPEFKKDGVDAHYEGTHCSAAIGKDVQLLNENGSCILRIPGMITDITSEKIQWGNTTVIPTLCGLAFQANAQGGFTFELEMSGACLPVRVNSKCFCLMQEKFRPFVTVSCIGTLNEEGAVVAPCTLNYQKLQNDVYHITVSPEQNYGKNVFFEVNLYENKLLQDTTVNGNDIYSNNAFGTVAFLGESSLLGEEWLYVRPDLGKMPELRVSKIESAVLHMPRLSKSSLPLRAHGITTRFCSFGTSWSNKIPNSPEYTDTVAEESYVAIPVTPFFADESTGIFKASNGWILKPEKNSNSFAALSTADSSYAPQILEVKFA